MNFDTTGLLTPQGPHAERLNASLDLNKVSWDGSITGAGKTFSACAIIRHRKQKFVVICPKKAIPTWKKVLAIFNLTPEFIINLEKLSRGNTKFYKRLTVNKYRKLHNIDKDTDIPLFVCGKLTFPKDWLIIVDESHKCKGVDSLNAGILFNIKRQGYTAHLMSATQACSPLDMRAFGYTVDLHNGEMKKFKEFCEEAGAKYVGKWGAMYFESEDLESMSKLQKVRDYLFDFKKIGSRLTRKDFGDLFPEVTVENESIDMGNASIQIKAVYDEMEYELDRLEEKTQDYAAHVLAIIVKARRRAELLKVPTIVEMLSEFHDEGRSGLVFLNYTDTIESVIKRLSEIYNPNLIAQIYGGRSDKQCNQDIEDFQLDKKIFAVANLASGGQSISLHDIVGNRGRSSIINPSYSAISVLQSAGRTDRANTKSDVYLRFLLAAGTIESTVGQRYNNKSAFISALNDGTLTDADLIPNNRLFKLVHGQNI